GHGDELVPLAVVLDDVRLVVLRIQQKRQRHLEDLGDLTGIGLEDDRQFDHADHRINDVPGPYPPTAEPAENLHSARRQADLLLALPQSRRLDRGIIRLYTSTRKADLARMAAQSIGA